MAFVVACQCGQRFSAEEQYRGQQLPCPSCSRPIVIQPEGTAQSMAVPSAPQTRPAAAQPQRAPAKPAVAPAISAKEIPVTCQCGKSYAAPPSYAGHVLPCPACGSGIQVPQAGAVQTLAAADPFAAGGGLANADPFRDPFAMPAAAAQTNLGARPAVAPAESGKLNPLILWGAIGGGGVVVAIGLIVVMVFAMGSKPDVNTNVAVAPLPANGSPTVTPPAVPVPVAPVPSGPTQIVGPNVAIGGAANPTNNTANASSSSPFEEATGSASKPAEGNPFEEVAASKPAASKPASAEENPFEEAAPMGPSPNTTARANLKSGNSNADEALKAAGLNGTSAVDFNLGEIPMSLRTWQKSNSSAKPLLGAKGKSKETDPIFFKHSWMCDLLPHLGHQKVYDQLQFDKSTVEKSSVLVGRNEIREFLNPMDMRKRADESFAEMALTHFVGMSGVEDQRTVLAARLPRTDPRAGVFGYDEVVPTDKIKDGSSQTIMMIGSGELSGPWMMAGGATVRGARPPAFDALTGFGTKGLKKPGAVVVMADGSVRQIPADIDSKVFRAMCTVNGADSIDLK